MENTHRTKSDPSRRQDIEKTGSLLATSIARACEPKISVHAALSDNELKRGAIGGGKRGIGFTAQTLTSDDKMKFLSIFKFDRTTLEKFLPVAVPGVTRPTEYWY